MPASLKIGTWNVNGIRARLDQVQDWVLKERPDVFCLQEIKASPDQIPMFLCELEDYWCYWHGSKGYSGVGLLVRKELSPGAAGVCASRVRLREPHRDRADAAGDGGVGLRAERRQGLSREDAVPRRRSTSSPPHSRADALPLVICGDLNVARTDIDVHPKERKPRATGQLPEERALLERIISHDLVDVGRALDPDNDQLFTWWAPWREMRQRNIGWRLDYVLASQPLFASVARLGRPARVRHERSRTGAGGV